MLFTPNQVDKINLTFIRLDEQKEINSQYLKEKQLLNSKISILDEQYSGCQEKVQTIMLINKEKSGQVESLELINKKQQKDMKFLKKSRNLYGIGGVVVGGIITYSLTQIIK